MPTNPSISLIIVNYQSARYLEGALRSIFLYEGESDLFEIIVVNNDVTERLALFRLQTRFHFVLVESKKNGGFGYGNNLGASYAKGEIIGFINPDILWIEAYIQAVIDFFHQRKTVSVVGVTLLDENKRIECWSVGREPSLKILILNNMFPSRYSVWRRSDTSFPDWVSGGALFIRKEIFSSVGGFDEQFFLYFEDVDLCAAVRARGFRVAYLRDLAVIHLRGKSSQTDVQKMQFHRSQRRYFQTHRPLWENIILRILHRLCNITESVCMKK